MADLILLNGPPASGKSTLAQRFVEADPFALNLDIDVLRGLVDGWAGDPEAAGLAARSVALVMARDHLTAGNHVVVPQFLGRPDFIEELAVTAYQCGARFLEVALWLERSEAIAAFADRSAAPSTQAHRDAAMLVEHSSRPDPVGSMYDDLVELIGRRPQTIRVDVIPRDVDATFQRFREALT